MIPPGARRSSIAQFISGHFPAMRTKTVTWIAFWGTKAVQAEEEMQFFVSRARDRSIANSTRSHRAASVLAARRSASHNAMP